MKFFTMDWWLGDSIEGSESDRCDPFAEYRAYLCEIRQSLPASVMLIAEPTSLHDTDLVALNVDLLCSTVLLALNGDDGFGNLARMQLTYEGVSSCSIKSVGGGWGRPNPGLGDLGYHEVELVDPGTFEQRLLFSNGIELSITFNELRLSPNFRAQSSSE